MTSTGADLLIVGGHRETVAELVSHLRDHVRSRLAGTFVIDPRTKTPARVREYAEEVVRRYEADEQRTLVSDVLTLVAAHGLAAAGISWCLLAANERAVELLLVDQDRPVPGRLCPRCGWLGLAGSACPVCGSDTRETPDVIDAMAVAVADAGGSVTYLDDESEIRKDVVAARLRFPVAPPDEVGIGGEPASASTPSMESSSG